MASELPFDFLNLVISRKEVDSRNIAPALGQLTRFLSSPNIAREFIEGMDIGFSSYDDDPRELDEIKEVRDYVALLDSRFPYWLFFLSKYHLGLQCIARCLLPAYRTTEERRKAYPEFLQNLLLQSWFPAMNRICEFARLDERQIEELSDRAVDYFVRGRIRFQN